RAAGPVLRKRQRSPALLQLHLDALVMAQAGCPHHRSDRFDVASALADHLAHVRVGDVEMDDRAAAARLALHIHGLLVLDDVLCNEAREVGVVGHSAGSTSVAATGSAWGSGSGSGAAGAAASTSAAAFAGAGRGRAARTPCS